MVERTTYKPKQFNLSGLKGISDKTLQMHFKLYEGYVKSVNELNEKIAEVLADGRVDKEEFPAYSELTRRLGFEYNGMVLHEYYFDNLKRHGSGDPGRTSVFIKEAESSFGSYAVWKTDFSSIAKGWGVDHVAQILQKRGLSGSSLANEVRVRPPVGLFHAEGSSIVSSLGQ